MTQENYMALADFQNKWTNDCKPFIQAADRSMSGFAMLMPFLSDSTYVTKSIISSPEFFAVILDSEDKIIAGVRRDMTYVGLDIPEAIEAIIDVIA